MKIIFVFLIILLFSISACDKNNQPKQIFHTIEDIGEYWGNFYLNTQTEAFGRTRNLVYVEVNTDYLLDGSLLAVVNALFKRSDDGTYFYTQNSTRLPSNLLLLIYFENDYKYLLSKDPFDIDISNDLTSPTFVRDFKVDNENIVTSPYHVVRRTNSPDAFNWLTQLGIRLKSDIDMQRFIPLSEIIYFIERNLDEEYESLVRKSRVRDLHFEKILEYERWAMENDLAFSIFIEDHYELDLEDLEIIDVIKYFDPEGNAYKLQIFVGPRYVRAYF